MAAAPKKAAAKAAVPKSEAKEEAVSGDAGAASLQALADKHQSQGYWGTTPDPHPNEAYSLASGPDGPSVATNTPADPAKKES